MEHWHQSLLSLLKRGRDTGFLTVVHALLTEALLIGLLYALGLITVEALLPTFVTTRFSIALFIGGLILLLLLTSALGHFLALSFPRTLTLRHPLALLGLLWGVGLLLVSLVKFPFWSIPLIIALFLVSGYHFFQLFLEEK